MANGQVISTSLNGSGNVTANKQSDGSTALTWTTGQAHEYANNGRMFLQVKTGSTGGTMTVTTHVPSNRGLELPDRVIALTASMTKLYGPFPPDLHNDEDGNISVAFSATTGLEVTAFSLPSTY